MSSATAASPTAAPGSIPTTTRRRWRASSPIAGAPAPPSSASSSRTPAARPRRSGRGRAAARCKPGQDPWETIAPSPIPFGAELAHAARGDAGRHRARARGLRQFGQARGADRLRRDRAALRPRLSRAFVPVAGLQPAHRPVRRLAGEPHALRPRDRAGGARGGAEEHRARRAHHRQRLARRTGSRPTTRSPIPRRSRPTASTTSTCRPAASPPTPAIRRRRATTCRSPSGSSARPASPPAWSA